MALLMLITGLETDVRLLRNLGRAALIASAMGMMLPFVLGFGLGYLMPAEYLADPQSRILFSAFLATAMSISAMPVIAKILVDLDLTKRNIGLVILSAGVVDDTVGWLILSLIAGVASQRRRPYGAARLHAGQAGRVPGAGGAGLVSAPAPGHPHHRDALSHARLRPGRDDRRDVPVRGRDRVDRRARGLRRFRRRRGAASGPARAQGDRLAARDLRLQRDGAGLLRHRRPEGRSVEPGRRRHARAGDRRRLPGQAGRLHAGRRSGAACASGRRRRSRSR